MRSTIPHLFHMMMNVILHLLPHRRYFNYEELVQIKDTVLAQHTEWKERVESEKNLKNLKRGRLELELASELVDEEEEVPSKSARAESPAQNLPKEACWQIQLFHLRKWQRDERKTKELKSNMS